MNGNVKKAFLLVGTLVFIFIVWQLFFNDGGVFKTAYNAVANGINAQWAKVAGASQTLIPTWGTTEADNNGKAFDIDTKK